MKVDIFKEAAARREKRFSVLVNALARVMEVAPESKDSEVQAFLSFGLDENGQRYMDLNVVSVLTLRCQRCLGTFSFHLDSTHRLVPIASEDLIKDLMGDVEPILLDEMGFVDVITAIEEEILLALPMYPMHEQNECEVHVAEADSAPQTLPKKKLFAGLADLIEKQS